MPYHPPIMKPMVPSEFYLSQNYPNPFRGKTTIKFCLPERKRVQLDVCRCESKMIVRLMDEDKDAGSYEVEFDASGLCEGSYLCVLQAGEYVATKRMQLKQ